MGIFDTKANISHKRDTIINPKDSFCGKYSFNEDSFSENEKEFIRLQNELIYEYATKRLKVEPYAISRDKNGHILLIAYRYASSNNCPEFLCYTIGLNNETNKLTAFLVGKNIVRFTSTAPKLNAFDELFSAPNNLYINNLTVHQAFSGLNIGRILLQTSENYAVENKIPTMTLKSLKCYEELKTKSKSQFPKVKDYFDKNLYFYYSQGFKEYEPVPDGSFDYLESMQNMIRPLKKRNLQKIILDYGFNRPLVKIEKTHPCFSIKRETIDHTYVLREFIYDDKMFPNYLNNIVSESFSPLITEPTEESLIGLYSIINQFKTKPVFNQDKENIKNAFESRRLSKILNPLENTSYSFVCADEKFVNNAIAVYQNKLNNASTENYVQLSFDKHMKSLNQSQPGEE